MVCYGCSVHNDWSCSVQPVVGRETPMNMESYHPELDNDLYLSRPGPGNRRRRASWLTARGRSEYASECNSRQRHLSISTANVSAGSAISPEPSVQSSSAVSWFSAGLESRRGGGSRVGYARTRPEEMAERGWRMTRLGTVVAPGPKPRLIRLPVHRGLPSYY